VGATARADAATDLFSTALGQGPLYAGLAAFVGGLLVCLTPCVYPMIAITISVFGGQQSRSRRAGVTLSAMFVLGIVAMFVPLGLLAGLTGGMFGAVLQNRWVLVGVSAVFLALAASMFGAFELALPSALANRLARVGGIGHRGAFGLGLVSGLIAAPCTGPVLVGILTWIANTQDALLGAAAMVCFALGLGTPFFLVGALAVQLPKSGGWMVQVKSLLGLVLAIVALYFLTTAFPILAAVASPTPGFLAAAAVALAAGLLLGAIHRSFDEPGWGVKLQKGCGIVLSSVAAVLLVVAATKPSSSLAWEPLSVAEARTKAREHKRPLLVDITASWCVACKELDRFTFSAPSVREEGGRFVAIKVDATDNEDPAVESVMEELRVVGLPTVLLFDSSGREAARCTDFVPAEPFRKVLEQVQ
jgi:thiol:disulfide interchange protein DsbD